MLERSILSPRQENTELEKSQKAAVRASPILSQASGFAQPNRLEDLLGRQAPCCEHLKNTCG